ncbi:hypothetical protein TNCV_4414531 [Trichonephila clavipes]|uniref:Uncharacterized protein n=1 Tax=Trichonephila clavipes TaxID=2585209 RepID=A0A8X6S485_TRICX|nr:hypothetical protein TNCV_4414531 [Trichonephila clavipes]
MTAFRCGALHSRCIERKTLGNPKGALVHWMDNQQMVFESTPGGCVHLIEAERKEKGRAAGFAFNATQARRDRFCAIP